MLSFLPWNPSPERHQSRSWPLTPSVDGNKKWQRPYDQGCSDCNHCEMKWIPSTVKTRQHFASENINSLWNWSWMWQKRTKHQKTFLHSFTYTKRPTSNLKPAWYRQIRRRKTPKCRAIVYHPVTETLCMDKKQGHSSQWIEMHWMVIAQESDLLNLWITKWTVFKGLIIWRPQWNNSRWLMIGLCRKNNYGKIVCIVSKQKLSHCTMWLSIVLFSFQAMMTNW